MINKSAIVGKQRKENIETNNHCQVPSRCYHRNPDWYRIQITPSHCLDPTAVQSATEDLHQTATDCLLTASISPSSQCPLLYIKKQNVVQR